MSGQANHRRDEIVVTLAADMLRWFGEFRFIAWGSSMVPSIFPGDTLIVQRETPEGARPGDIVLFVRRARFYAHRLVDKAEEGGPIRLIARGDALRGNDPPFVENEMLGRVGAVVRGRKRIELDRHPATGERLLRWIVQHSSGALKWLLRWHSVRVQFAANADGARGNVRWQPQESV
jgi:Peptidase S24-like